MDSHSREEIQVLFNRLYRMLTLGCQRTLCSNKYCLRSPDMDPELRAMSKEGKVAQVLQMLQKNTVDIAMLDACDFSKGQVFQLAEEGRENDTQCLLDNFREPGLLFQVFRKGEEVEATGDLDVAQAIRLSDVVQNAEKELWGELREHLQVAVEERPEAVETLRYVLFALQLEKMYDYENMEVLNVMIKTLVCAEEGKVEMFVRWLGCLERPHFRRMVELLQNNLTVFIITLYLEEVEGESGLQESDEYIEMMCMLMEKLYKSNLSSQHMEKREFYNDAISLELVDPREQFEDWKSEENEERSLCFIAYPFLLDLGYKYELLKIECVEEQEKEKQVNVQALIDMLINQTDFMSQQFLQIFVRRDYLLEDTLNQLSKGSLNFKKELRVQFVGEQGLDEGGVRKELLHLLVKQLFDLDYGMFVTKNSDRYYWFNQYSEECSLNFELIGTLLGLAIYNNINLDLRFPPVVYAKLRGEPSDSLECLRAIEPEVANNLQYILDYEGDLKSDLQVTFSVTNELYGEYFHHALKEGGADIPVDNQNREEYVRLYVAYYLNTSIANQFDPFLRGFRKVMDSPLMDMFSGVELMDLVCGQSQLDFNELQQSVFYKGYTKDSPLIQHFWDIVHAMEPKDQKRLLFFVTGSDRAPVRGLGSLNMVIEKHGEDTEQLPSAHTCYNYFLLPQYKEKSTLEKKLYLAITHAEGFGLF